MRRLLLDLGDDGARTVASTLYVNTLYVQYVTSMFYSAHMFCLHLRSTVN